MKTITIEVGTNVGNTKVFYDGKHVACNVLRILANANTGIFIADISVYLKDDGTPVTLQADGSWEPIILQENEEPKTGWLLRTESKGEDHASRSTGQD